jgi:hypothetical protein
LEAVAEPSVKFLKYFINQDHGDLLTVLQDVLRESFNNAKKFTSEDKAALACHSVTFLALLQEFGIKLKV